MDGKALVVYNASVPERSNGADCKSVDSQVRILPVAPINTSMQVDTVSQVLGWVNNLRVTETRNTYNYDKGNSVTVVSTRTDAFTITGYNPDGTPVSNVEKGSKVDVKV